VLEKALILEELSSHIIKLILRLVWDETKTLSNKSTSLSFKNKIDLLFDLQDLTKDEYNYLLKIMEVRNQFAHNFNCNLWEDFKSINPKSYEYIKKKFPNEDESFSTSFRDLFNASHNKLIDIERKYLNGFDFEIEKIITNEIFQSIDKIIEETVNHWVNWCEELDIDEFETKLNEEEFKIDAIKKMLVLKFLKYRDKLYKVYHALEFDEFRENLRRKEDDIQIDEYVERLDKKYEFVYNDEWDEGTKEVLEDDYLVNENTDTNTR